LENERKLRTDELLHQTVAQYYKLPRFLKQEKGKVITVSSTSFSCLLYFVKIRK